MYSPVVVQDRPLSLQTGHLVTYRKSDSVLFRGLIVALGLEVFFSHRVSMVEALVKQEALHTRGNNKQCEDEIQCRSDTVLQQLSVHEIEAYAKDFALQYPEEAATMDK